VDVIPNSVAPSMVRRQDDTTGWVAGTRTLSLSVAQTEADVPIVCAAAPVPPQDNGVLMLGGPVAPYRTEGSALTRVAFLKKVVCYTIVLLQAPTTREPGNMVHLVASTPWHSRRIAGAGVEFQMGEMARRTTKKVMKSLNIIGENDGVNQQAQEAYSKLFSEPLSCTHLQVLAALFGWSNPESSSLENSDVVIAS
jgi:hypothetical protein